MPAGSRTGSPTTCATSSCFPVLSPTEPGTVRAALPASPTVVGRTARRRAPRSRRPPAARDDALAVPGLHGLLRVERVRPGHPRRDARGGAERERHAVADRARGDRAGTGDAGLAAPDGRPAGATLRRDQRHRVVEHAVRACRRPRGTDRSAHPRARDVGQARAAAVALLRLRRGAFICREGGHRARDRTRRPPPHPGRRALPHGSGRVAPGDPRGHRRRHAALRGGRDRRDDVDDERRSRSRRSPASASTTASGCTSMRRTAALRRSRRSCAGCSTARSGRTRSC